jgi:stearoyl-CoA desaturase (delta-9 desaturase)
METLAKTRLDKIMLLAFVIIPLIAVFVGTWMIWETVVFDKDLVNSQDIAVLLLMYVITGIGITAGYHRMLTHRSFDAHPVVRFLLLAFGSMAVESGALTWARIHLQHHAYSDEEGDPHSPLKGFYHAHFGWMIDGLGAPEGKYDAWLTKDPMVVWFEKTFVYWVAAGFIIPFLIAGWSGLFWGALVRISLGHHVTWSVNSICHTFGKRMFKTTDLSRNQWVVGLLAFGEGWHNNHHAFPRSAFHGMRWYQFDGAGLVIRLLEKTGLATNVWRVPQARFEAALAYGAEQGTDVSPTIHMFRPGEKSQPAPESTPTVSPLRPTAKVPESTAS